MALYQHKFPPDIIKVDTNVKQTCLFYKGEWKETSKKEKDWNTEILMNKIPVLVKDLFQTSEFIKNRHVPTVYENVGIFHIFV